MAKKLDAEEVEKIDRLLDRHFKADAKAKAANMEIGAEKKKSQDAIRASAGKLGFDKGAWNDFVTEMGHFNALSSHRQKVVDAEDETRLTMYDRLLLSQEPLLALFTNEEIDEIEASAAKEPVEDEVTDLDERRAAKAAEKAAKAAEKEVAKEAAG